MGLLVGQPGLLQDGALALGEAGLAGAAVDHADASGLAAVAAEGEISVSPAAGIGASGILAAEVFDGMHAGPSGSQQSRGTPLGRIAPSATSITRGPQLRPDTTEVSGVTELHRGARWALEFKRFRRRCLGLRSLIHGPIGIRRAWRASGNRRCGVPPGQKRLFANA